MESDIRKNAGTYSMIASYLLVLTLGVLYGPKTSTILQELIWFFTGQISKIPRGDLEFMDMIPVLLLVIAVKIPAVIIALKIAQSIVGKAGKNAITEMLEEMRGKRLFLLLFGIVFVEELVFRGVLLGLVPKIESLSGTLAFYIIAGISTFMFAIVHLPNFGDNAQKKFVRVLPQFVGGLFLVYVFYKFGLLVAVLCHFGSNAILFSSHKLQNTNWVDGLLILLQGVYVLVAWIMLDKPISDTAIWFQNTPEFKIPGWEFWDYFWVALLFVSVSKLALDMLLYDKNYVGPVEPLPKLEGTQDWGGFIFVVSAVLAASTIFVTKGYQILHWFIDDIPMCILISSVILCLPLRSPSASATQRIFWSILPATYMAICLASALSLPGTMGVMLVMLLVHVPVFITARWDD